MTIYETIIIFHPDLSEEDLEKQVETVRERFSGGSAEISACEDWGKRRLAYTIRRQRYGLYVLFRYSAPAETIRDVENRLNINEQVLKLLTVRCRPGVETPSDLLKSESRRAEGEDSSEHAPDRERTGPESPEKTEARPVEAGPSTASSQEGENEPAEVSAAPEIPEEGGDKSGEEPDA
jgi:small subunit ribosomal protein S6